MCKMDYFGLFLLLIMVITSIYVINIIMVN
jgi:hypothetical protein